MGDKISMGELRSTFNQESNNDVQKNLAADLKKISEDNVQEESKLKIHMGSSAEVQREEQPFANLNNQVYVNKDSGKYIATVFEASGRWMLRLEPIKDPGDTSDTRVKVNKPIDLTTGEILDPNNVWKKETPNL